MVDDNIKIEPSTFELTRENAKEFYFACGCTGFGVWHEGGYNCEKFYKLNIPKETLNEWSNEWIKKKIDNFYSQKDKEYIIWGILSDFVTNISKENIYELYNLYKETIDLYSNRIRYFIFLERKSSKLFNETYYKGFLHLFNYLKDEEKVRECLEEIEDIVDLNTKEGKQYLKQVKEYCKDNNIDYKFSK